MKETAVRGVLKHNFILTQLYGLLSEAVTGVVLFWHLDHFDIILTQITIVFRTLETLKWSFLPNIHCIKSVRIRSYSGPHFPAFGLNTERYGVSLRIQSKGGKMRTRITPNTNIFHKVLING